MNARATGRGLLSSLMRSGYDQFRSTTTGLPGGRSAWRAADDLHNGLLQSLKASLDALEDDDDLDYVRRDDLAPREMLRGLIDRSLSQRPELAEHELYARMLEQLVPDEARVLAALSDGSSAPICHLDAVNLLGTSANRILSNVSRIGVECGVMLGEYTPYYVAHLRELGFVTLGPEDKRFNAQYELIENDSRVREASRRIERELQLRPRTSRHTLRLSDLGLRLWAFCQQQEQPGGD